MAYIKIALLAAIAALASAQTQEEIDELNVILNDVKSNLQEYISLAEDSSSGFSLSSLPSGVLDIGLALASATDDSYTTLYSEVDFAAVSKMLTMVPWYSSRLLPELESLLGTSTTAASSTEASSAATSSAVASSSETTSSAVASSSEATSSAVASSSEASSSAATSSAVASSSAVSSAVASSTKASAISQISDGQVQATSTVSEQTENGAAKAVIGMGAGVMAAAAMLL
ncbi:AAR_G0049480.mRNA.1.CDS.1 [Saccharomyces cerevisiae]|nr:Tir2p [Saccharomyces cerevisiae YJM271]CAI4767290.1 AAR_G0049480.mRNA.1.CDS.1 [Saccharomyces cerevisiae]CAI4784437.1 AIG_G0049170.mRNA.1.CDS.1 [Saccharomyces cerevisiae]CAI6879772.1 AAR_G0049480.mRNA.1.CDS.1 [Saccharomyces cerevisiae]CAI6880071.1 AIG_G0049170.mRNA.1.CDS.1 [Saccharomyces cerevisiae]